MKSILLHKSGDMEAAQKFVNDAAERAGYNSPLLYHGTKAFGFTEKVIWLPL